MLTSVAVIIVRIRTSNGVSKYSSKYQYKVFRTANVATTTI